MATVQQIYDAIDRSAPYKRAEKYDNTGIMIDSGRTITKALLAMDVSHAVIDEALKEGAQLILTHHPLIFTPIKRLTHRDLAYRLIKAEICCISAHTNLDAAAGGVNDALAACLGVKNTRVFGDVEHESYNKIVVFTPQSHADAVRTAMAQAGAGEIGEYSDCSFSSEGTGMFLPKADAHPFIGESGKLESVAEVKVEAVCPKHLTNVVVAAVRSAHPYEEPAFDIFETQALQTDHAMGRIGEIEQEMPPEAFAQFVKERLNSGSVRYTKGSGNIKRVALCGGAGGSFANQAIALGADAYVTADLRYYQAFDAMNADFTVIDAGHFATETVVMQPLAQLLSKQFPDVSFTVAASNEDGWQYL